MLELRTLEVWQRLHSSELVMERRPHIVPTTDEEEEFLNFLLRAPHNQTFDLLPRFYTGFGTAVIDEHERLCCRFKLRSDLAEAGDPLDPPDLTRLTGRFNAAFNQWKLTPGTFEVAARREQQRIDASLRGEIPGPVWTDECKHGPECFVASYEALERISREPTKYDLYVHGEDSQVCLRYGDGGSEYLSSGGLRLFLGVALASRNPLCKYRRAAEILEARGTFTWVKRNPQPEHVEE